MVFHFSQIKNDFSQFNGVRLFWTQCRAKLPLFCAANGDSLSALRLHLAAHGRQRESDLNASGQGFLWSGDRLGSLWPKPSKAVFGHGLKI
jgi:hypothetical protein